MSGSMIPCLTWVRRGKAKSLPKKVQISKEDIKKAIEETQERLEDEEEGEEDIDEENIDSENVQLNEKHAEIEAALDAAMAVKNSTKKKKKKHNKKKTEIEEQIDNDVEYINDINAKYKMDDYDKEDSELVSNPLAGIANLTVFADNADDPYITLKEGGDSDEEDFEIKDSDNLIIVAQAQENYCSIEKHVYNSELVNLYVHDDFLLSSFPLTLEWLDYDITEDKPGNFVAIGTMDPTIDIWDLDLVNAIEPVATLGQKIKKKKKGESFGHKDAVLDLSWNQNARHVIASASADKTVIVWDLTEGSVAMTLKNHKDKVQCVKWHPFEEHMLLTGSFDKTVKLFDCRSTETTHRSWAMAGEIEKVLWNHHSPLNFFASTDSGHIYYMDTRQDKPIYTLSAHNDAVTGMSLSCEVPNLFVTASVDETVKIWDISDNRPAVVTSSNLRIGPIHCMASCPDGPFVFAFGGPKEPRVWDIRENADVFSHFCSGKPKVKVDNSDAMETDEVAMETEPTKPASLDNMTTKKKKKKKKNTSK